MARRCSSLTMRDASWKKQEIPRRFGTLSEDVARHYVTALLNSKDFE
jgi:hypothetical protein